MLFSTSPVHSNLTRALFSSTSAIDAHTKRVHVISQNLANAHTRPHHKDDLPYCRQVVSFKSAYDKYLKTDLVQVHRVSKDKTPFQKIYDPHDPAANDQGIVLEANINPLLEMTDLMESQFSHDANIKAFERVLSMLQNTLNLLKPS
jgi:flagellar basal-body rod protein FlgC